MATGRRQKNGQKPHGRWRFWKSGSPDFRQNVRLSDSFCVSRWLALVIFLKSNFWGMISVDLRQHHGSAIEIIWSSSDTPKLPTGWPRKHTFCPTDQEIDWTDVAEPLVATNVWIFIVIWHQRTDPSMIISRRVPKDAAWPATLQATRQPINEVKWPFYGNLLGSLTHYFERPNQKPRNGSYKSN